ncbi:MAG: hypothetical protein O2794_00720 [bacterium]|nr:hypothetical protein [bacterium]
MTPTVKLGGDGESFKFPTFILVIGIMVILGGVYYITTLDGPFGSDVDEELFDEPGPPIRDQASADYFRNRVSDLVVERVGQPIEGVESSSLLLAFPALRPSDFDGVTTSADGSLTNEGYTTLLGNIATRHGKSVGDTESVDEYLRILSEVPILVNFGTHVVYDSADREISSSLIAESCSHLGGKVNQCGSMCPRLGGEMLGGENCPAVCVLTCDLDF